MHDEDDKPDGDYEVGYGRPPKHTQFKPGQSGNAKGRPRKSKDIDRLIGAELDKVISVREDGRDKRITKREAIVTQLVNRAIKGETKPLQLMLDHLEKHRPVEPFTPTDADDAAVLASFLTLGEKEDEDGNR